MSLKLKMHTSDYRSNVVNISFRIISCIKYSYYKQWMQFKAVKTIFVYLRNKDYLKI